jgi:hypothetical protein
MRNGKVRLIDYLRFYVPLKNFSLIWRRHHCPWRAAKSRPMLGAQGLWAGRDVYRVTPAVTRGLSFFSLIRRTAPFSRLLRHTRGCGGSILTRILTTQGIVKSIFLTQHMIYKIYFTCISVRNTTKCLICWAMSNNRHTYMMHTDFALFFYTDLCKTHATAKRAPSQRVW